MAALQHLLLDPARAWASCESRHVTLVPLALREHEPANMKTSAGSCSIALRCRALVSRSPRTLARRAGSGNGAAAGVTAASARSRKRTERRRGTRTQGQSSTAPAGAQRTASTRPTNRKGIRTRRKLRVVACIRSPSRQRTNARARSNSQSMFYAPLVSYGALAFQNKPRHMAPP
eukprot:Amastigsp_a1719_104.p2 type:complete len:175 gc:universal Amastigsp_a1719_104:870-346(-)